MRNEICYGKIDLSVKAGILSGKRGVNSIEAIDVDPILVKAYLAALLPQRKFASHHSLQQIYRRLAEKPSGKPPRISHFESGLTTLTYYPRLHRETGRYLAISHGKTRGWQVRSYYPEPSLVQAKNLLTVLYGQEQAEKIFASLDLTDAKPMEQYLHSTVNFLDRPVIMAFSHDQLHQYFPNLESRSWIAVDRYFPFLSAVNYEVTHDALLFYGPQEIFKEVSVVVEINGRRQSTTLAKLGPLYFQSADFARDYPALADHEFVENLAAWLKDFVGRRQDLFA